jgi:hypothetical protein
MPDWRSSRKPDWYGARVEFEGRDQVPPGDEAVALLTPGVPASWSGSVEVGDVLEGGEGGRITVVANVLGIDQ